jgi:hypothetical protein
MSSPIPESRACKNLVGFSLLPCASHYQNCLRVGDFFHREIISPESFIRLHALSLLEQNLDRIGIARRLELVDRFSHFGEEVCEGGDMAQDKLEKYAQRPEY